MPDYRNMTATEALRHAKEQSGKTAEEIAEALGVSTAVVTRYFRSADSYGPSLDKLPRLCEALGNTILVDWLRAQTQEADEMPAAQSRAEVLTAVARATAALGEVSRLLIETENCGIDQKQARAIRSGLDDVKLACSVTQGMLDDLAASEKTEVHVLASFRNDSREDVVRRSPQEFLEELYAPRKNFQNGLHAVLSGAGRSSWILKYYSRLKQKQYLKKYGRLPDWFHALLSSTQIRILKLALKSSMELPEHIDIPETAIDKNASNT